MSISDGKTSPNRVCIVGPGAMGLLHAAYLKRVGVDVHLLDHNRARAERINREKIILADTIEAFDIPCHAAPDFGPVDLLIFFVKAYSTLEAAAHAAPLIGLDTVLLTLQNGLGNLGIIEQYQRLDRVLAGTTTSGATLLEFNLVRQEGLGNVEIGSPQAHCRAGACTPPSDNGRRGTSPRPTEELAGQVVELFQQAGLPARVTGDVLAAIWRKAIINSAINPLTAITGLENGQLVERPHLRQLLTDLALESARAAAGLGLAIAPDEMPAVVEDICRLTAHNRSSMLQDITHGRRTEIEQISGEFVRAGLAGNVETPLNRAMLALVKGLEA